MSKYWLLDYTPLTETPEIPAGYGIGLIDEKNPAPKGAMTFENETELNRAIKVAEKNATVDAEKTNRGQLKKVDS